jgi:hypothetical protein
MKPTIKIILKAIVYLLAVIGAMTVGLFIFLKTSRLYEVSVNFNKSRIALFDERVDLLRTCGAYSPDSTFVDIEYVKDGVRAKEIMDYFQLDTLYDADASTWDKALAIGKFVAFNIPHENQKIQPEYKNAIGLWEYTKNVEPAFNCRLHSIMTFELLTAAGIKARYITCLPQDKNDQDCHVVNEVWLPETQQWAMLDTDMGGHYVTDLDGRLLSLRQMREKYINGEKMKFYPGFEKGSSRRTDYYAYMAKNTYWFCCWGALGFYQEDYKSVPESVLRNRHYALVPEGFEPFRDDAYTVTHDPDKFWK